MGLFVDLLVVEAEAGDLLEAEDGEVWIEIFVIFVFDPFLDIKNLESLTLKKYAAQTR